MDRVTHEPSPGREDPLLPVFARQGECELGDHIIAIPWKNSQCKHRGRVGHGKCGGQNPDMTPVTLALMKFPPLECWLNL